MGRLKQVWPDEPELAHLVRAAQAGRPGALDALLAALRPPFVAYFAVTLGHDDAEDAAQLALLDIVRVRSGIDPERALGYVLAIAGHQLDKARQRRARAQRRSAPLEAAAAVEWPGAADWETEYHELVRLLPARLAGLPHEWQEVVLESLDGVRSSTLAAQQHVRPATIRSRRRRARRNLRAALAALR
jgi:RNA polymerase sigma-70 factor (ECF subfamily)